MLAAISLAAVLMFAVGCADPDFRLSNGSGLPSSPSELEIRTELVATGSFNPSGAVGTPDCDIILMGGRWGTIARIRANGSVDTLVGYVPTRNALASLEIGAAGRVLAWAKSPAFLGVVEEDLEVKRLPVPTHPWGGRWVGPAIPISGGRYAIAAIADRRHALPSPQPWVHAPMIQILDSSGAVAASAGSVKNMGGRYLSWLAARAALGQRGDTTFALTLSNARLLGFTSSPEGNVGATLTVDVQLPVYFREPEVVEEVVQRPWITVGGENVVHTHVSHVETAAFGGNRLYAIRNYDARWRRLRSSIVESPGYWEVIERGLEIHDTRGRVLGRYRLPRSNPSWIRADSRGRIFLKSGRSLLVLDDPTFPGPFCPPMPRRIPLEVADLMPRG